MVMLATMGMEVSASFFQFSYYFTPFHFWNLVITIKGINIDIFLQFFVV
jgi:hypothetical protein